MEEDDDSGTVVQGSWVRKKGYVSEFPIDARWILYHQNDSRPQGSLRIVSFPDLPPGHLKSFVSIVVKRSPKSKAEIAKTLENYGLLDNNDLYYHDGVFYKNKKDTTYFVYNNVIYKTKKYEKMNGRIVYSYFDQTNQNEIMKSNFAYKTQLVNDELSVVEYSNPISDDDLKHIFKTLGSELEAFNVDENIQTWDSENMDKMRNLEKLYNVKIFE